MPRTDFPGGAWTPAGTDTTAADGWSLVFTWPQGIGHYELYSVSTDADGNVEPAPVRADARVRKVASDTDGDGLSDIIEDSGCTYPDDPDTDDDGLIDGIEDANANGSVDASETDPCLADTDADGLPDGAEDANMNGFTDPEETDPSNPDSDGDGYDDGDEIAGGGNPLDPGSVPTSADGDIPVMGPWAMAAWSALLAGTGMMIRRSRRTRAGKPA